MAIDPYNALGLPTSASDEDVRKAYRKLAKRFHPDRNAGSKAAEEQFKTISAAYGLIGSPELRKAFDAQRRRDDPVHENSSPDWSEYAAQPGKTTGFDSGFNSGFGRKTRNASRTANKTSYWNWDLTRLRLLPSVQWNVTQWLVAGAVLICAAASTLPFYALCNDFFDFRFENRFGMVIPAPVVLACLGGALAILSKDLFWFSLLAAFLASVGYGGVAENFLPALYFCSFVGASGAVIDGVARSGGSEILLNYDWEHEGNAAAALVALCTFCVIAAIFLIVSLAGLSGVCAASAG